MKKCKSCGVPSKNKTYEGDTNKYNVEHCQPCAHILHLTDLMAESLSRPNIFGQSRKVVLIAKITK